MLYSHRLIILPNNEIRSSVVGLRSGRSEPGDGTDVPEIAENPNLTLEQYSRRAEKPTAIDSQISVQKAGYGALGRESPFSNLARRKLLHAGASLQREHPVNECLFLTMTLPGSTIASFRALAEWSAYAVQLLKGWIGKRVKSNLSLYVWEWQKRGALHLHYVVHVPCPNARQYIQDNLQAEWIRILDAIARNSGVDVYSKGAGFTHANDKSVVQVRAEICKYSVAGYLAKYLGKGSNGVFVPSRSKFTPSRWYGVSRPLHALIAKYTSTTERVFGRMAEALKSYEDSLSVLHSQSLRHYSYRHGNTHFRTCIAYFKETECLQIWNSMTNQNLKPQSSSTNGTGAGSVLIQDGLNRIANNEQWEKHFASLSSPYVKTLVSKWNRSDAMCALDKEYLLDSLAYSLSYLKKTGWTLTGWESMWLKRVQDFIATRLAERCRPYTNPSNVTNC